MKGFGPGLSETDAASFGKQAAVPERHFVPEVRLKTDKRTAGKFCCNRQNRKAWVAEANLVFVNVAGQNNSNLTS